MTSLKKRPGFDLITMFVTGNEVRLCLLFELLQDVESVMTYFAYCHLLLLSRHYGRIYIV